MATNVQADHISAWQTSYDSFIPQICIEHLLYAIAFFSLKTLWIDLCWGWSGIFVFGGVV